MRLKINGRPATAHIFEPTHWEQEVTSVRFEDTGEYLPRELIPTVAHYLSQGVRELGGLEYSQDDEHITYEIFE